MAVAAEETAAAEIVAAAIEADVNTEGRGAGGYTAGEADLTSTATPAETQIRAEEMAVATVAVVDGNRAAEVEVVAADRVAAAAIIIAAAEEAEEGEEEGNQGLRALDTDRLNTATSTTD